MAVRRGRAGAGRAGTKATGGRATRRAILAGGAASLAALGALRIALPPGPAPVPPRAPAPVRFPDPATFAPRLGFLVPVSDPAPDPARASACDTSAAEDPAPGTVAAGGLSC